MKKTSILVALAAVLGLALAAAPALAAGGQGANEQSVVCPFHDGDAMTYEEMHQWMESGPHSDWMDSGEHSRIHSEMGDMTHMMGESRFGSGSMRGGMMGGGHMGGFSG